jgi:hypothetical protein
MIYLYGIHTAIMMKAFGNIITITNGKIINLHVILIDVIFNLQNPFLNSNWKKINEIVLK